MYDIQILQSTNTTVQNPLVMNDAWYACEFAVNVEKKNQYIMLGTHICRNGFFTCSTATRTQKKGEEREKNQIE